MERVDKEKLLYKLVIQFLVYLQGTHKLLDPHLSHISKSLKAGATLYDLAPELHSLSKTLTHIAKSPSETKPISVDMSDVPDYVMRCIGEMLDDDNVPPRFQQQTRLLRLRTADGQKDEQSYKNVVDSAINLLLNIKDHAVSEQKNIDCFLSDLASNLSDIEQQADFAALSNRQSIDNRQNFNDVLTEQVDAIKDAALSTGELGDLRNHTAQHLQQLITHLVEHKQREDERQLEAQQKIEAMAQRLHDLESETELLRNKLRIEHDKAMCDPLTSLPNRLAYNNRFEMEINRCKRYHTPLSLVIWDIDHFKRINDNYGHKSGDKTLALVGQLLLNNCRETDFVARYGGEEFVMLLPNTRAQQAYQMANAIRQIIEGSGFNANGEEVNLTLSGGISDFMECDEHDEIFVRADQALYLSKQQGRNQCNIYGDNVQ